MVELYGLKKCSTCVKAKNWLEQREIEFGFTDYRESPLAPEQLERWSEQVGGWEKLVNRASMTWRNLPEGRKSPNGSPEWLALIAQFPALVKRPVLVDTNGEVHLGYSEKKYGELFA